VSEKHADSLLEDQCAPARTEGISVQGHTGTGDPVEAIVRVAEQERADVIVVGNKGMGGVRRVLGSVPNSVAHRPPCSVLIVQTT
jgi:nucleotide-binding universal stress UspA family protein